MRTAEEIRAALHAPDFGSVKVWRVAPGFPPEAGTAVRSANDAAETPAYVASFGAQEISISRFEYERLMQAGVTDLGRPPSRRP